MFAIVITLLVLELPVPPAGVPLLPALAESWPDFLGYFISFTFVGGIWLTHASLTRRMTRGDGVSFRLNLVLLLCDSLLPFSTRLMVSHIEGESARGVVTVYGINLFVAYGMLTALLYYAARDRYLVVDDIADAIVTRAFRRQRTYLILTAVIILVGLVVPVLALSLYIVLTVVGLVRPLIRARRNN